MTHIKFHDILMMYNIDTYKGFSVMTNLTHRPIQVYLEERQSRALRSLAKNQKTTLSELIRRGVDLVLSQIPPEEDPAYKIIALGESDFDDLSINHDQHILQILEEESLS
ncbi:MAG: hypothetical protein AB1894_27045 [Chloroflexota bacterium]